MQNIGVAFVIFIFITGVFVSFLPHILMKLNAKKRLKEIEEEEKGE